MNSATTEGAPSPQLRWRPVAGSHLGSATLSASLSPARQIEESWSELLRRSEVRVGACAQELLGPLARRRCPALNLVRTSVAGLGLEEGAIYEIVVDAARRKGWSPCPQAAAPAVRLAYQEQPAAEWILIATKPIIGRECGRCLFAMDRDHQGLWLRGMITPTRHPFHPKCEFIFCSTGESGRTGDLRKSTGSTCDPAP